MVDPERAGFSRTAFVEEEEAGEEGEEGEEGEAAEEELCRREVKWSALPEGLVVADKPGSSSTTLWLACSSSCAGRPRTAGRSARSPTRSHHVNAPPLQKLQLSLHVERRLDEPEAQPRRVLRRRRGRI